MLNPFNLLSKKRNFLAEETLQKRLKAVIEVNHRIAGVTNQKEILELVSDKLISLLGVSYAVIWLHDEDSNTLKLAHLSVPNTVSTVIEKFMGQPISQTSYDLSNIEHQRNLTVKTFLEGKLSQTQDLYDAGYPLISKNSATILQALLRISFVLHVPLIADDKKFGVLGLIWNVNEFTDDDKDLVTTFSDQISTAIYNARLFTQVETQVKTLEAKNHDLQSLFNLTTQISKSLDPEEVAQTAVNSLPQDDLMIGAVLSAYDREKGEVYVHSLTQNSLSYQVEKIIGDFRKYKLLIDDEKYKDNLILKAVKYENIQSSDKLSDMLTPVFNKQIVNLIEKILQIKSVVVYPVRARGEIIGTITYLLKSKVYTELGDNEKQLFETFTNQISIALENANLFTQQKLTQRELQRTLKELNERRRFEQDMIDVMGHELRTPMSIVRNALSLMDMELKSKGQIALEHLKKYVTMGLEAARREVNLIETLLSATKSEGKGFQLILEKVNLVEIVNNSILGHSAEASKKNLKITFHESTKELFVYADKTRTQEISDNFMSNAIKYTDKGGVEIKLYTENKMAYVSYIDSGIGISEEDISKLGQKFFRAQQYTDEEQNELNIVRPGGTGLGLYVSFGLIKVMDGDLRIQSKVDVGSTFTFGLPLYTNQERKQLSRNATNYKTDTEN